MSLRKLFRRKEILEKREDYVFNAILAVIALSLFLAFNATIVYLIYLLIRNFFV